jgi:hypothetical protein
MTGYDNSVLKQFVELVQGLYSVRVDRVHFGQNNVLSLYTDSRYEGLNEIKFPLDVDNEEIAIKKQIERLKTNPIEDTTFAKECMLRYWIGKHPRLRKMLYNRKYQHLLELASDKKVSAEYFEKAMKGKSLYGPLSLILPRRKIEPTILIKEKKEKVIIRGALIETQKELVEGKTIEKKDDMKVPVINYNHNFIIDPVEFGKSIIENSRLQQEKLDTEKAIKEEEEKTRPYRI